MKAVYFYITLFVTMFDQCNDLFKIRCRCRWQDNIKMHLKE